MRRRTNEHTTSKKQLEKALFLREHFALMNLTSLLMPEKKKKKTFNFPCLGTVTAYNV